MKDDFKVIEEGRMSFHDDELSKSELKTVVGGGICVCDARFQIEEDQIQIGICICDKRYHAD